MSYPAQLRLKERKVRASLERIGKLSLPDTVFQGPVIGMKDPFFYRNKSEYPIGRDKNGKLIAGFYAGRTHSVIDGSRCAVGIPENRVILDTVLRWMGRYHVPEYRETDGKGVVRNIMIRCGFATGQVMVVIVAAADRLPHEKELVTMLRTARLRQDISADVASDPHDGGAADVSLLTDSDTGPARFLTGIVLNTNKERTNVILGRQNRILWGSGFIEDQIRSVRYRISPLSFYQVNPRQTVRLYETVLKFAGLTGRETVWDLYCGIGTISLFLARKAKKVYGVEVIPDAIENARQNAALNHIDNARFLCGKAEEVFPEIVREERVHADVVVVDPPRKGLDPAVIDAIVSADPDKAVYVSCSSATLARDLGIFEKKGYAVRKIQIVDMFPQTVHVETLALMSRVKG